MLKEYLKSLEEQRKSRLKTQSAKETMNEDEIKQNSKGLIFFALFWCGIVFMFDGILIRNTYSRLQTFQFTPVSARILNSQVEASHDSDGSSYHPKINFEYSLENKKFTSDKVYAEGAGGAGENWAKKIVNNFPANSSVTAYVNPQDPSDATLIQGFSGDELALSIFLTPFNLIALLLILANIKKNTMPTPSPLSTSLAALGISAFLASFVVGFIWDFHPPLETGFIIWAIILSISVCAYFISYSRMRNSRFL